MFFISITEIIMLVVSGSSLAEMKRDILLVTGGMLLFGAWFCFFAKDILPTYYDANKINYVSQGIFRIHLVGLSFNNGNWIYICTTLKIWTLATVVLYPLAGIIIINCFNIALWDLLNKNFLNYDIRWYGSFDLHYREKIRIIKLPVIVGDSTNLQHSSWEI